jgi:putative ergosteryl-3beta-O-L-aspartate hydrolase
MGSFASALLKPPPNASPSKLLVYAWFWRSLESIGQTVHHLVPPWPPSPTFTRRVSSTLEAGHDGEFLLRIYVPAGYKARSKPASASDMKRFPAVINFHGGGFTIGSATDDARFAQAVITQCRAVFISVEYRLAPKYPFPVAVEDCADALLYVISHADELHIDPHRLATAGFSAGGNLAFTSLLRLTQHLQSAGPSRMPDHKVVAVAAFYPAVDYTLTRLQRRATAPDPSRTLSSVFSTLFDAAYLPELGLDRSDPLLSPAQATDDLLQNALPNNVMIYACEFDMLRREAKVFADRLAKLPISKSVHYEVIEGVEHGWDKMPIVNGTQASHAYADCCSRLQETFGR